MTKYTITVNEGMVPNQLYGVTDDGQHFYFRGRMGKWQLHFGATEDEAITGAGYEGEDERAGWFELADWEAFFWEVVKTIEDGTATPLDLERHQKDIDDFFERLIATARPITDADWSDLRRINIDLNWGEQK